MYLTAEDLGQMLKEKLNYEYDPLLVADWAYNLFIDSRGDIDDVVCDVLNTLALMELGDEFTYSKAELEIVIEALMKGDNNPFKQLRSELPKE